MSSLARKRYIQAVAAQMAAAAVASAPAQLRDVAGKASEYDLQRARLGVDLRRLKSIQSVERKIEAKREMVAAYDPWVEGVLSADSGAADDILIHMMIWSLDIEDYRRAHPLVGYVLRHRLDLPERYQRTAPTLIAEESADAALKRLSQGEAADLQWLVFVDQSTAAFDMHDQVRAKLKAAIGRECQRRADAIEPNSDGPAGARATALKAAISHFAEALRLDQRVGVKKDIERAQRDLKKLNEGEPK